RGEDRHPAVRSRRAVFQHASLRPAGLRTPRLIMSPAEERTLASLYRDSLLEDVIPFWLRHGLDREHGGFITSLGRDGSIIDTDKSVWFQGRAGWMLATLCNTVESRPEWLEAARSCIEFLRRHGFSSEGK